MSIHQIEQFEVPTDAQLLACDFVAQAGIELAQQVAALVSAASVGDVAGVEARLWCVRRILLVATRSWREAVPSLDQPEAKDG